MYPPIPLGSIATSQDMGTRGSQLLEVSNDLDLLTIFRVQSLPKFELGDLCASKALRRIDVNTCTYSV